MTVASLQEHLRSSLLPILYLLNRSLEASDLQSIAGLIDTRSIVPPDAALEKLPRQAGFPPEASFPLLLADVLPDDVQRVLFLDPDLLVLDDIGDIWDIDLGGKTIAAARDLAIPTCSSPRGVKDCTARCIPDNAPYFNAGVMLIDVARWRSTQVSSRVRAYVDRHSGHTDFLHQEALNAVLWNDWHPLDQRWNLIASLTGRRYSPPMDIASPGIVHFAGRFKPWQLKIGGPFAGRYLELLRELRLREQPDESLSGKALGVYDRYLRDYLYSIEQRIWQMRWI